MKSSLIVSLFLGNLLLSSQLSALTLQQSYELAQQGDPAILAAKAEFDAAQESIPQARSALLPQLSLDVFSGDNEQTTTNGDGTFYLNGSNDSENEGYRLNLSQTLYNHQLYKQLDQAKASVAQAAAFYAAEQQALMLRVAEHYFAVLAAEDGLRFAQAEKKSVGQQLEQTKKRFEVGLIAITDVKEAQAQYDATVAAEIVADNQLATSRELLQVIINQPVDKLSTLNPNFPLQNPDPDSIQHWTDIAEQNNLALRAARYALEAAQAGKSASLAGHYPSLSLEASQSDIRYDSDSAGGDVEDTRVSVNLNIPLYSGGNTQSLNRQAGFKLAQAQSALELQQRLTRQQVRSAYLGLKAAIASVKALQKALESSQTAVEATTAGFEVGTRTSVDVLDAVRNQFRAERDFAQSRYNYLLNRLKLRQAAGTLNKTDIDNFKAYLNE